MSGSELASVAFGLASAAAWGAGDFCGGLATKRSSVYGVIIVGDAVGGVLLAGLALAFAEALPSLIDLFWGAAAGVSGAIGLIALYRALASGRMSVASPVAGVVTATIPVIFGAFVEGLPGVWQMLGFGFALVGVWMVSSNERVAIQLGELGLPVIAGLGFGVFFILIDRASHASVFWPLVTARLAAVAALVIFAAARRQLQLPQPGHLRLIVLVAVLDAGGNAFFTLAARAGRLDVASVLSSLYPASTVGLAWLVLKERVTRLQLLGIVATLAAIALIAL
jgi:drug/metabolite transporter (DMT)-like permease